MAKILVLVLCLFTFTIKLSAQDNYEIQVYGAKTMDKKRTMVELHTNFTFNGTTNLPDGQVSDQHIFHETIEITHGFTSWFEIGVYLFNAIGSEGRTAYVGSHIRPRIAVPEEWKWPVGLSLSLEYGLQKAIFSPNTNTLEIRPIIDKKWKRWYGAINIAMDQSFAGPDVHRGLIFSPNIKVSYDVTKITAFGFEYYGTMGPAFQFDPLAQQAHQLFAAVDLDFNPEWEFNAGYGVGFTNSSAGSILKLILGRRI